jgi:hypothetical protein
MVTWAMLGLGPIEICVLVWMAYFLWRGRLAPLFPWRDGELRRAEVGGAVLCSVITLVVLWHWK